MPDDGFLLELALIGVLILFNGFFAAAEIALVSARPARLQALAEAGDRKAQAALRLKKDIDPFLATVQIGVTLVGTLASAVGGVAAIERLEPLLAAMPYAWVARLAEPLAVAAVVLAIAYLSLVAGELLPKSLAVRNAETLARWMAPPVERLSRLARPGVALLTLSTRLVLRLLGQKEAAPAPFHTLQDLRVIAEEAEEQGVVEELVSAAVEFHERQVREVMTPRPRISALRIDATLSEALEVIRDSGHSRFPVYQESLDDVAGFAYARDVYEVALSGASLDLAALVRPALTVPGWKPATELLEDMRQRGTQMALVVDEHGALVGLVTLEDLLEVIVGEIRDEHASAEEPARVAPGGSLEVDGGMALHEINDQFELDLPESPHYVTIAGLILERLGRIPVPGDHVEVPPYVLTVLDVEDGRRIRGVRVETVKREAQPV